MNHVNFVDSVGIYFSWIETQSLPSLLRCYPSQLYLLSRKSLSSIPAFLISLWASSAFAGDAVAIGYNADGVWTDVTYFRSATRKGGKDYRTAAQARQFALRDVRRRSKAEIATTHVLSWSDSTGFVAVARGKDKSERDFHAVGRGESQAEADKRAISELNEAGAGAEQKIVYRYFSYGANEVQACHRASPSG